MSGAPAGLARPPITFERLCDYTPLRLSLFMWLCVYATWAIFHAPRASGGTQDWQFFEMLDEVARKSVLEYGQFPLWNPYWCGGITHVGNPQTTFLTPTFPLVLWFGSTLGERLSILAVLIVACEGGYRLCRFLGMGAPAALLGAVSYPLFGRSLGWLTDGQMGLHGITLAPWVIYGWLRGLDERRYLVLGAAFLAWILAFRGIQPGPQLALALGLWALLLGRKVLLETGSPWRALWPLAALAIVGVLAAGFIGVRMLPVLDTVLSHPRIVNDHTSNNLTSAWFEILAMPPATRGYSASGYAFVGHATFALFLGALVFAAPRRRAAIPLVIAVTFMFITLGDHGEFSLYHQLHRLPFYKSLRNPTLYVFTGALFVVLGGATALDELDRWLGARPRRWARRLAWLAPVVALGTGVQLAWLIHRYAGPEVFSVEAAQRVPQEFKQSRGNHFVAPLWPNFDRGSLDCYDETPWAGSPLLRADAASEEYLADPGAGTVRREAWSPNRIELSVDLARPARLLVNQNWDRGWRASVGRVRSEQGLLAVDLPAGRRTVALTMRPPLVLWGLAWTALTLAAAAWLIRGDPTRRKAPPVG